MFDLIDGLVVLAILFIVSGIGVSMLRRRS